MACAFLGIWFEINLVDIGAGIAINHSDRPRAETRRKETSHGTQGNEKIKQAVEEKQENTAGEESSACRTQSRWRPTDRILTRFLGRREPGCLHWQPDLHI
jgi:hypothetical protein